MRGPHFQRATHYRTQTAAVFCDQLPSLHKVLSSLVVVIAAAAAVAVAVAVCNYSLFLLFLLQSPVLTWGC